MQPYLFPYIGYFQLLKQVDEFIVYDDVQHIKRGWINRNNYLINGEGRLITISLFGASTTKLINEIDIQDDFRSYKKSIKEAYAKAPYFKEVYALIEDVCSFEDRNLARFITNSIEAVARYLSIDTQLVLSSSLINDKKLKGQDKILSICKMRNADRYINPIGGLELYDRAYFGANGVDLYFIKSEITPYVQYKNEFVPSLSIVDVLMFNSPKKVNEMLDRYELV